MARRLTQAELNERGRQLAAGNGWCMKCRQFKPLAKFSKSSDPKDNGHRHYCKRCDKASRTPRQKQQILERARRLSAYYTKLAGGECCRCGYSTSVRALEFHHLNREEKEHNPAAIILSGDHEAIIAELDKCIQLCANCHREFEAKLWAAQFVKRVGGLGYTIKPGSIIVITEEDISDLPLSYRYTQKALFEQRVGYFTK